MNEIECTQVLFNKFFCELHSSVTSDQSYRVLVPLKFDFLLGSCSWPCENEIHKL